MFSCSNPPGVEEAAPVDPDWLEWGGGSCSNTQDCRYGHCRNNQCECWREWYFHGTFCDYNSRAMCSNHGNWNRPKALCKCDDWWVGRYCEINVRDYCNKNRMISKLDECECQCKPGQFGARCDLDEPPATTDISSSSLTKNDTATVKLTFVAGNGLVTEAPKTIRDPNVEFVVLNDAYGKINIDLGTQTMTIDFEKRMMSGSFYPSTITLDDIPVTLKECTLREGQHDLLQAIVIGKHTITVRIAGFHLNASEKQRFVFDLDFE